MAQDHNGAGAQGAVTQASAALIRAARKHCGEYTIIIAERHGCGNKAHKTGAREHARDVRYNALRPPD
jgi:hypothetical protein